MKAVLGTCEGRFLHGMLAVMSCMCDMTHSYMWHDFCQRVALFMYM